MGSNSSTVEMSLSLLVLGVTVLVDSTLTHTIVTRIPVTHTPGRSHFTPSNLATKRFVDFGSTSQRQFNLPPLLSNTKGFLPSSLPDTRLSPSLSSLSPQSKTFAKPAPLPQTSHKPSSKLHKSPSSVSGSIIRSFTDIEGSKPVSSRLRKTEIEQEPLQTVVLYTQGDEGRPGTPKTLEALKSLLTLEELVEAVKSLEPEEAREVLKELETQVVNIDRNDFEEFSVMLHPEEELAGTL